MATRPQELDRDPRVYVQEIRTVERQARRRARMEAQYGDALARSRQTPRAAASLGGPTHAWERRESVSP